jgi:hypothetical protein
MIQRMLCLLWRYRGCLVPPLAVLAGFGVLAGLLAVLGETNIGRRAIVFESAFDSPAGGEPGLSLQADIFETGLWWLLTLYLFWLTAIAGCGVCLHIAGRVLREGPAGRRRAGCAALASIVVGFSVLLALIGKESTLVSAQDIIAPLEAFAGGGFRALLELTFGFGILSLVVVVSCAALLMVPVDERARLAVRARYLHGLLYAGAAIIVTWIVQARILYGFAATVLIEEQRHRVADLAPTISLVVGAVASVYLILMYLAAFLWLQSRYADFAGATNGRQSPGAAGPKSPLATFKTLWLRVFALAGPALPGTVEFIAALAKPIDGV